MRRMILRLVIAVIAGAAAAYWMPRPLPEISRAEFLDEIRAGHIRKVEIHDQETMLFEIAERGEFRTGFDRLKDAALPDELPARGIEVWFTKSALGI